MRSHSDDDADVFGQLLECVVVEGLRQLDEPPERAQTLHRRANHEPERVHAAQQQDVEQGPRHEAP